MALSSTEILVPGKVASSGSIFIVGKKQLGRNNEQAKGVLT